MVYIAICHFELLQFVDEKRHFLIFTSEGFVVSTFRQSQPLVGQDALSMLYGLPCMSLNQVCFYQNFIKFILIVYYQNIFLEI